MYLLFRVQSLVDDGLGDIDGVLHIVHIEIGIHVVVEEVADFVVGESFDVFVEPFGEGFVLGIFYLVFINLLVFIIS